MYGVPGTSWSRQYLSKTQRDFPREGTRDAENRGRKTMMLLQPLKVAGQIVAAVALAAIPTWLEAVQTDILLPLNCVARTMKCWPD